MSQPSDQVRIRRGNHRDIAVPVKQWAAKFQDYAALAAVVYRNPDSAQVPDPAGWTRSSDPGDTVDNYTGLYFEVWEHASETAVVFRGTQFFQWQDWWSNLRWVTRFLPIGVDQYNFVRRHIDGVVARARSRRRGIPMVSVGHSLGGGLAQHAAYSHKDIKHVFAFDSSPVTGIRSVAQPDRDRNRVGIQIKRVYEAGEILAFLRGPIRWLLSLSPRDPEIVEVRFNFRGFGLITQHSMVQLVFDLQHAAATGGKTLKAPVLRRM